MKAIDEFIPTTLFAFQRRSEIFFQKVLLGKKKLSNSIPRSKPVRKAIMYGLVLQ